LRRPAIPVHSGYPDRAVRRIGRLRVFGPQPHAPFRRFPLWGNKPMKFAVIVWRNLRRSRRRSLLTIVAISLAAFTYSSLAGLPSVTRRLFSTPASARRVVVTNTSGFFYSLPAAYRAKILAVPHVVATSAFVYFGGIYREPSDQLGVAVDSDQAELMWPDWGVTPKRAAEFRSSPTACLVPAPMMLKYGWHVGQQIMLKGTVLPVDVTLRIADTLGDKAPPDALLFRRDYLDGLLGNPGRVNAYHVMVDHEKSVAAVIAAIDETFSNSAAQTHTESEATWFGTFMQMDTLFLVLEAVSAAVVIAVSLIAMNTVVMEVRERLSEIAIMRAIGFGPGVIFGLTVAESSILGLAGGIVGCAATFVIAKTLPVAFLPLGPVDLIAIIPPRAILQAFGLSLLIGAVAGTIPAIGSVRRNVADALRAVV
jgi:putative ABC transport system permease protein